MAGKKIRFFPLDISYKVIDDIPVIMMFGRTSESKHICVADYSFRPYFLLLPKEKADAGALSKELEAISVREKGARFEVIAVEKADKKIMGRKAALLKVYTNIPKAIPVIRDMVKGWESVSGIYEADIKYVRRYLIDKSIIPFSSIDVTGEVANINARIPVIKADSITPTVEDTYEEANVLGFDIETYSAEGRIIDPEKNPIMMISLYGKGISRVITWKRFKTDNRNIIFVDSEAEMIEKFREIIANERPDILTGYYSDAFDLPYIDVRARKYKIKLDFGLDYSELDVKRKKSKSGQIPGIIHLDTHSFIRNILGRTHDLESLSLENVSTEYLGEKKMDVDLDKLSYTWDNEPEKLGAYCDYNLQDSRLAYLLCRKILPNIIEFVKMLGINMFDVARMGMSQLVEWYLIRLAFEANEVIPNKPDYNETRKRMARTYKGGYVYEPEPGIYRDIVIFDYRSLYPSIISAHNISPETLDCMCCSSPDSDVPKSDEVIEGHWFCTKRKGFIPSIVEDLISRRMRIKKMSSKDKSNRLLKAKEENFKLLANSFYGYLGFFAARWYSIECAEAVTSYGRHYINRVINKAHETGFVVVYGDTDSIFLLLENKSLEDAKKLIEDINMKLPELMELEFEGYYPSGIFVKTKASDTGAKKRYALLDEKGRIVIKGFETIRRNWSTIGKEVQKGVLEILLKDYDPEKALNYLKRVISELREEEVGKDKVTITTQLQKNIDDYDSQGPHVKAAIRMKNLGYNVLPGMNIRYIVTKGTGKISDRVRLPEEAGEGEYDHEYYINNQVIPSVERLLNIFGYTKEDILESKEQSRLDGFFR